MQDWSLYRLTDHIALVCLIVAITRSQGIFGPAYLLPNLKIPPSHDPWRYLIFRLDASPEKGRVEVVRMH